jgi:hypothetical protein
MAEGFINLSRIAWLVGVGILVMVANVLVSILYMVVYGYLIDPGHDEQYYNAHIQAAAPYSSIVAGIPLMFLAGFWISRWWGGKFGVESALVVWLVYALIDFTALMATGFTSWMAILVAVSLSTKLAAIYAGAVIGARRTAV